MHYPLLLTFRTSVVGSGFLAEISARGRVLASVEPDGCWLYGVNPGGIAVEGANLEEAHRELRDATRRVFLDFASEAASFEAFKASIEKFFETTNEPTADEWNHAVARVREMNVTVEGLPTEPAGSKLFVTVTKKLQGDLSPQDNVTESRQALATAA